MCRRDYCRWSVILDTIADTSNDTPMINRSLWRGHLRDASPGRNKSEYRGVFDRLPEADSNRLQAAGLHAPRAPPEVLDDGLILLSMDLKTFARRQEVAFPVTDPNDRRGFAPLDARRERGDQFR